VTGRLKHNFFGSASSVVIAVRLKNFQQPVTEIIELVIGNPDRPDKTAILECDQLQAFFENH
jgi:hypothetical protein